MSLCYFWGNEVNRNQLNGVDNIVNVLTISDLENVN